MIRAKIQGSVTASACGIEVKSPSPVLGLCRALLASGSPSTAAMEAYRGDTLCLSVRSIGEAAELEVNTGGTGFSRRKSPRRAPPASLTAISSSAA